MCVFVRSYVFVCFLGLCTYIHTYIRKSEAAKGAHSNQNKPERNQWECVSVRVCVKQDIENIIVAVKLNTHTYAHFRTYVHHTWHTCP